MEAATVSTLAHIEDFIYEYDIIALACQNRCRHPGGELFSFPGYPLNIFVVP